ncbi:ATP-dependent DNA ligase [Arthrobacter sp. 1088]|uniref:hypothetical protein n=1 Tax=Arthrobacter sp. 1088 TaxID=2817768 RepID=UPI0028631B2D|nr:hypothetical protein [Arthrobacter sp. 1088]MDR6685455.1 ATP-dependent DNA ligase [Arthrobacter sp. 1088]
MWADEPKRNGHRTIALVDPAGVTLWSRQGRELTRVLPRLREAQQAQVPPVVLLDGESVI